MATLKLKNTTVFTETNGIASIPSAVKFPAGHVIQVVQSTYNAKVTFSSTLADAMSVNLITKQANSKFLVQHHSQWGRGRDDYGGLWYYINSGSGDTLISEAVGIGATGVQTNLMSVISNRGDNASDVYFQSTHTDSYLHSPSLAKGVSVTYKLKAQCIYGTNVYLNGQDSTTNNSAHTFTFSTMTVMELSYDN